VASAASQRERQIEGQCQISLRPDVDSKSPAPLAINLFVRCIQRTSFPQSANRIGNHPYATRTHVLDNCRNSCNRRIAHVANGRKLYDLRPRNPAFHSHIPSLSLAQPNRIYLVVSFDTVDTQSLIEKLLTNYPCADLLTLLEGAAEFSPPLRFLRSRLAAARPSLWRRVLPLSSENVSH
jgi:hypothetical protein